MTAKSVDMTSTGPKKKAGWFSWRHQTSAEHLRASAEYREHRGRAARRRRAAEREAANRV